MQRRWRPEHRRVRSCVGRQGACAHDVVTAPRVLCSQMAVELCDGRALALEQAESLRADLPSHSAAECLEVAAQRLLLGLDVGEARGELRAPGRKTDFEAFD